MSESKGTYVIGLMSGTSLDGIDAALVNIKEDVADINVELIHFTSMDFQPPIKEELYKLCHPDTARLDNLSAMNMYLGECFAETSEKVITESGIPKEEVLLISSHGQTIYHQPEGDKLGGENVPSTLQIGDIGVIAEKTGITTVGDFRTRDMAAGGQGAPLVPYADYLFFKSPTIGRILLNIGGIANMTILPKNAKEADVFAYDTGPGNMMIDAFAEWATNGQQTYDVDGVLAESGQIDETWLNDLLNHPYFKRDYPKSTGRELFGKEMSGKLWKNTEQQSMNVADRVATITELTARSVAMEIQKHAATHDVTEVLVSGGGRYNPWLMKRLAHHLPELAIKPTDDYDMNADAKEAIVFALLGYQCYHQRINTIPTATGASKPVVMGKIAW